MKKLKVLYIASGPSMTGGATKSLIAMLHQAQSHGIEMEVVCNDENGLAQWLKNNGYKVHVVNYRHVRLPFSRTLSDKVKWIPRLLHDFWINRKARKKVVKIAKEFAPDIIHENSSVINVGYYASKKLDVPNIIHIREYGDLDFNMVLPGRMSRLKDKNVYSISITKDLFKYLHQDTNSHATQIYNGIVKASDLRFFEDKQRWFLYAGRIEETKGLGDLLDAYLEYSHATDNPMPLYICGGCTYPDYLMKLKTFISGNGIGDQIIWLGEREDIAEFMAHAAATVIPSKFEALGRTMPEAMANGSLCVARNTGGTKEQIDNGLKFTGAPIAIAYDDKSQLKKALLDITEAFDKGNAFTPGSNYRKMIERSQDAVREFFSEERFGEKLIEFYDNVVHGC